MTLVNISEAATLAGISRSHLYKKYIETGEISVNRDAQGNPRIDITEIQRVFGELDAVPANVPELKQQLAEMNHHVEALKLELDFQRQLDRQKAELVHRLESECDFLRERLCSYEARFLAPPVGFIPRLKLLMGGKP